MLKEPLSPSTKLSPYTSTLYLNATKNGGKGSYRLDNVEFS